MSAGDSHSLKPGPAADPKDSVTIESSRTVDPARRKVTLPDLLSELEATDPPTIEFPSQVERMVAYRSGVIVGLSTGDLAYSTFQPDASISLFTGSPNHTERISCLAVAQNEQVCVSGSRDNLVKVWEITERREVATLSGHTASVTCVTITGDGKVCASGSRDNSIRVWSVEAKKAVAVLAGHTSIITCLSLTPDSQSLISGSFDNSLKLWSLLDRKEVAKLASHSYSVYCLLLSPDGKLCFSGSADNSIKLWDLTLRKEVGTLVGHSNYIRCLALTGDGKLCASGGGDCTVKIWDVEARKEVVTFTGHFAFITAIVITSDSRLCISGSSDSLIKVWSLTDLREVCTLTGHSHWITCLVLPADRSTLISGSSDNSIKQWVLDLEYDPVMLKEKPQQKAAAISSPERKSEDKWSLEERREVVTPGASDEINCVAVTPDCTTVISGSTDYSVRLWNVAERQETASFVGHTAAVTCIGVTPDGLYCVSGSADSFLKLWSVVEMRLLATFAGHGDRVNCLAISRDGKLCVSGSADTSLIVWSIAELGEVATLNGHTDWLDCVLLTPTSEHCISSSRDLTIKVWHIPTSMVLCTLLGHTADIYCLTLTPDSQSLLSGSADKTVKVWDLRSKTLKCSLEGHSDWVYCLAVTPDGKQCLSGSADFSVKVWSLETHKEVATLCAHTAEVSSVGITSDGKHCVSAGYDHSVKLWSLTEMREIATLAGHNREVLSLAVFPSGQMCVSGAADNTVLVQSFPVPAEFSGTGRVSASALLIANIEPLKAGSLVSEIPASSAIAPHVVNSLHISAWFTHHDRVRDYLAMGVPFLRGFFGSPLTISLEKKSIKCVDVILEFLISQAAARQNDSVWPLFLALEDDITSVLYCNSRLLVQFLNAVMQKSAQTPLAEFLVRPRKSLPMTAFIENRFIGKTEFDKGKTGEMTSEPVDFFISLIKMNVFPGSADSVTLLKALKRCKNKEILTTPFALKLLEEKWKNFYAFTAVMAVLYGVLMTILVLLVFDLWEFEGLSCGFLGLNVAILLLELAFGVATKCSHWKSTANVLELCRGIASISWVVLLHYGYPYDLLTILVVILCFLRGFAHFRCFRATRFYVYLILEVAQEASSYLLIFGYSVFFFGVLAAIVSQDRSISLTASAVVDLVFGQFADHSDFSEAQWTVFSCASIANFVILMNLLISVLGESYHKAQIFMREKDVFARLQLVLEYELLLFWRRKTGKRTAMVVCARAEGAEICEWSGAILQIEKYIRSEGRSITKEVGKVAGVEAKVEELRGKMTTVEGRLAGVEEKVDDVGDKLDRLFILLKSRA